MDEYVNCPICGVGEVRIVEEPIHRRIYKVHLDTLIPEKEIGQDNNIGYDRIYGDCDLCYTKFEVNDMTQLNLNNIIEKGREVTESEKEMYIRNKR